MPDIEETKDQTADGAQPTEPTEEQAEHKGQSVKDKASGMMNDVKNRMDATGDGKFGSEDVKKMGEDAVNKVKGLFKKD